MKTAYGCALALAVVCTGCAPEAWVGEWAGTATIVSGAAADPDVTDGMPVSLTVTSDAAGDVSTDLFMSFGFDGVNFFNFAMVLETPERAVTDTTRDPSTDTEDSLTVTLSGETASSTITRTTSEGEITVSSDMTKVVEE